jgi:hypothetical protein
VRYPKYKGFAGLLSMALFRFPLFFNKKISFWKLLGCGRNGTFDIHPDWQQWAVLAVSSCKLPVFRFQLPVDEIKNNFKPQTCLPDRQAINYKLLYGSFINCWWNFFKCEVYTIILEPIEGYGTWDSKKFFGELPKQTDHNGIIAVLTRATIHLKRLKNFWQHVDGVALKMSKAPGFILSVGIGEMPWVKQGTFSIWQSKEQMKVFAYKLREHAEVIRKTRQQNWYSEEMFIRFKPVVSFGSLNGDDPLEGKL